MLDLGLKYKPIPISIIILTVHLGTHHLNDITSSDAMIVLRETRIVS